MRVTHDPDDSPCLIMVCSNHRTKPSGMLITYADTVGGGCQGQDLTACKRRLSEGNYWQPIDVGQVTTSFGEQRNIDQFEPLEQIAGVGMPVGVGPGGNLECELADGNNDSADTHASEM